MVGLKYHTESKRIALETKLRAAIVQGAQRAVT
jgi:hypothetical protein